MVEREDTTNSQESQENEYPDEIKTFLELNPEIEVSENKTEWIFDNAWLDDSVRLRVSKVDSDKLKVFENLRLPPAFSAIRHQDNGDIEFIYAAVRKGTNEDGRHFFFDWCGRKYECEFSSASESIKLLADSITPIGPSSTGYRNLSTIRHFLRRQSENHEDPIIEDFHVISFYLRSVGDLSDVELIEISRHLNFYIRYFDSKSAFIVIHDTDQSDDGVNIDLPDVNKFPGKIQGRKIDPLLLSFYESARDSSDVARRFLSFYHILEYASFYFIRDESLSRIRALLTKPDLPSCMDEVSRELFEVIVDERMEDNHKIREVIKKYVDKDSVWHVIESNRSFFSKTHSFDGGFESSALIREDWSKEDFEKNWHHTVSNELISIRNGIVHAREKRHSKCILPNKKNSKILRGWSILMRAVVMDLVVFGSS